MVSRPERTSQRHLQTTTPSSSHVTLSLSVPILFSQQHVPSFPPCSPSQPLFALSHTPLPDHPCPASGNMPHWSGRPGGCHRGRPPFAGSQRWVLIATPSLLTGPAQFTRQQPVFTARRRNILAPASLRCPVTSLAQISTSTRISTPVADTAWPQPRRRVRCKRTSPVGAHLDSTDLSETLVTTADSLATPPPYKHW